MFQDPTPNAELRLIDFGSGCLNKKPEKPDGDVEIRTTFAGSAFYISPEMFQRTYTQKTDVWSAGATLYVLVAGYPGDKLQKAFNCMQNGKPERNLKELPNMPDDMPDTYYEMLDKSLTYRHKQRPSAQAICKSDFAQFHIEHAEGISIDEVAAAATAGIAVQGGTGRGRTASIALKGSVDRHTLFLGFKKYERSLTALLASMLSKKELERLVAILKERVEKRKTDDQVAMLIEQEENLEELEGLSEDKQLSVVQVRELKSILRNEIGNHQA